MTKIYLLLLVFLSACSSSSTPAEQSPPVQPYSVEESLPDSNWSGDGAGKYSDGTEKTFKISISIKNNVVTTGTRSSDGYNSTALDTYQYTAKGKSSWLDPNSNKIGECSCYSQSCVCSATTGQLTMARHYQFSKIGLSIHEEGTLGPLSFEQNFQLKRQ
ncbi:MAG: hypothetical protein AB7F59_12820 [Bdellovibrionales bacterium]